MARRDPEAFIESFRGFSRCIRAVIAQAYAALDLGPTQAKFLRHVGQAGRMSQAELARATETDPTLTGRALETLVERGWVRRTRSDVDRRQYVLELSAAGRRARAKVEAARSQVATRIVAALDDRDRADFDRIADKVLAALDGPASDPARRA